MNPSKRLKMEENMKKEKGFTLIELLAVIVILAILMVIAVPKILNVIENSKKSAAESSIKLVKDAIKTQIASGSIMETNFTIDESGCYTFNFDDQTSGNAKELQLKNKENIKGTIKYCNGKFTNNSLVFNETEIDNAKYEYLYRANENNMREGLTSSYGTHQMDEVNGLLVYKSTDNSTMGTSSTSLISKSKIDFSKYNKLIIEFDSIKITGNYWIGLWITNPKETSYSTPPNKYAGTNINKSDYILTIDVSDITDELYVELIGTGRKDPNNTEFVTIDKDTGSVEAKIKSIKLQYNEN